jgi:hypothetical protein
MGTALAIAAREGRDGMGEGIVGAGDVRREPGSAARLEGGVGVVRFVTAEFGWDLYRVVKMAHEQQLHCVCHRVVGSSNRHRRMPSRGSV